MYQIDIHQEDQKIFYHNLIKSILLQEWAIDSNFQMILTECKKNEFHEFSQLSQDVEQALEILNDYKQMIEGVQKRLEKTNKVHEVSQNQIIRYPMVK